MANDETALIVGVGPGLGSSLARRFASAGMAVALAARDAHRHDDLVQEIGSGGGTAHAYGCDATREDQVAALFERVGTELGDPRLVVYNAGAFVPAGILDIAAKDFERCWRIGCFGGFLVGRQAARAMVPTAKADAGGGAGRGPAGNRGGTIIFTGASASLRGSARFANLAVGKFGLRALAQSMARELGPRGVHVAHVIIDGVIAHPKVGGQTTDETRLDPDAIAATYLMLHRQSKTAWTHELDLRPWVETF